jgi:hypothetical protein
MLKHNPALISNQSTHSPASLLEVPLGVVPVTRSICANMVQNKNSTMSAPTQTVFVVLSLAGFGGGGRYSGRAVAEPVAGAAYGFAGDAA